MILGLDLSSVNTGYAIISNGPHKGLPPLISYGNIKPPSGMSHPEIIKYTYDQINSIIFQYEPSIVVIEDQFNGINVKTLKLLSRISGAAMLCSAQNGCLFDMFTATQIKKAFTGNGRASKKDMVNHAKEIYKMDKIDDNAADAIGAIYTYLNQEVDASDN